MATVFSGLLIAALCATPGKSFAIQPLNGPGVYHTSAEILALTPEQASKAEPARLRGVVTSSTDLGLIVQDRTAGIWVYWNQSQDFTKGDEIEVTGIVSPGLYSPCVTALTIRKIGRAPLPQPKLATFKELSTGDLDDQYVSVEGIVRSMGVRRSASPSQSVWMKIAMAGGNVDATLSSDSAADAPKLIGATVRVTAPAMCTKNQNRQITAVSLPAGNMGNVAVLQPPPQDLFNLPLTPVSKLMQYRSGTNYFERVRVAGTVTYYKPGDRLIIEENGRALLILSPQISEIHLGDRVEAVGFPAPEVSGPILQDAVLRDTGPSQVVQPTPVTISEISKGTHRYDLVTTEGSLLRRVDEPASVVLLVQSEADLLVAELDRPANTELLQQLKEGSTVRISGINMLDIQGPWNYGIPAASVVRSKLLLRSPADVEVTRPPSWWTTLHLLYIAAVLGTFMLAFLALGVFNRVERWKLEAVLEERERLAHEIHDTLAQSFAGIGFQMQAIRRSIPDGFPQLQQQVELARDLVRHSHREARRSVEPLHLDSAESIQLLASLEAGALKMVEGCSVQVTAITAGEPRAIPATIATSLLRIGQEAIANALRHADPKRLKILLAYGKTTVQLAVTDDGIGFVKSGDLLGFGLRGMRTRAAAIGARLEILSQPGAGTRVEVTAPLKPEFTLRAFLKRIFKQMWERPTHVEIEQ